MGWRTTRPGPFAAGRTIRSNALILQLDPDDPDAEAAEIARLAAQNQAAIENALRAQLAQVATAEDALQLQRIADALPESDLRLALETLLRESAGRGVRVTADKLSQLALGVNWRLSNEAARVWAQNYSYELVSLLTENTRAMLADAIAAWVDSGEPLGTLIDGVASIFGAARAEAIAVTEATRAYAEGSFTLYEQAGFNTRPAEGDRPPAHPRCILPGTKVLPMGPISAATKSFYVGRCVEVTLGNGSKISVTENHPILTPGGWVQAKRLRQGDNVLYAADAEGIAALIDPDHDHSPTNIEEIFGALVESGAVSASRVPSSAEQFHGDGRSLHGHVDVVSVNRFLRGDVQPRVLQHCPQEGVEVGDVSEGVLLTDSLLDLQFVGQGDAAHRRVSGVEHGIAFAFGGVRPPDLHGAGIVARDDASFDNAIAKGAPVHTSLSRKFLLGFSGHVTPEQVVEVRDFFFSGHVYDLQCDTYELYTGNGILVKNCRCWVSLAEVKPGEWHYLWLTAQDELVCPICAPRHLTSIGFAGRR